MADDAEAGMLEIAGDVAAQSVCGGREPEKASDREAEVPRLDQLLAEVSTDCHTGSTERLPVTRCNRSVVGV
ncbi:MAG: hypothetical protein F4Z65_03510 [Acidobacteria bacterium]|nr:hypothetical protein [Acidobacteriota bacterium]MYA45327.1 hypothetical protein [Acidobacteriota bacterium]MYI39088.1 hypothetical protein [Acidobacteriota bacterium]